MELLDVGLFPRALGHFLEVVLVDCPARDLGQGG
jgi:hypothetical protein